MSLLDRTVVSLIRESRNSQARHIEQHLAHYETWEQLHLLKQLLCIRSPRPPLPFSLLEDIEYILRKSQKQRALTRGASTPVKAIFDCPGNSKVHLRLWQGDITALSSDVTAITNAANSQMLGCFQPTHKCIDNVIHSFAGPRLRQECLDITEATGNYMPVGEAVVTKGYCLPSAYIIHTVGPQLEQGADPTNEEVQQLRQCYVSVLEQADSLSPNADGSKRIALCGISTGLFAFPTSRAAQIAVDTVTAWFVHNEHASITDVIFVTFAAGDHEIYTERLSSVQGPWRLPDSQLVSVENPEVECSTLTAARAWLASADSIVISAGAGLSAADGLDYTSKALFNKHFPSFTEMGLDTLYSAIGFEFPTEEDKWAYYFTNIRMMRSWGRWDLYQRLTSWLKASGKDVHIRTSNADGLFITNSWDEQRLSTPQGRYSVLQCLANCRPESTFDTLPFYEAARPFLDPQTQRLTDSSKVPRCKNCGGEMMLCVRGGNWFNECPFQDGEARWRKFRQSILQQQRVTVILELGVGMNTPGVLRWPNEDLVRKGGGRVRLVRAGLGPSVAVPADLEEDDLAICIEGDLKLTVARMLTLAQNQA